MSAPPLRNGAILLADLIDLYMAAYMGRDTTRGQRLAWWKAKLSGIALQDLTDDHVHAALEELAEQQGRYFAGKDADAQVTDSVLDRIKPMAGAENAEAIRASVTAEVRAECADRMYRHAHAEGYSTSNLAILRHVLHAQHVDDRPRHQLSQQRFPRLQRSVHNAPTVENQQVKDAENDLRISSLPPSPRCARVQASEVTAPHAIEHAHLPIENVPSAKPGQRAVQLREPCRGVMSVARLQPKLLARLGQEPVAVVLRFKHPVWIVESVRASCRQHRR